MGSQQFCLRWNNHQSAVMSGFSKLLENETLVDVTIACAGVRIKAHKVVLSACSPYFQEIFEENPCKHPVIILKGFTFQDLKSIIDFMYKGEVNVNQQNLADFLKMAEELQVSGLMDVPSHHHQQQQQHHESEGRATAAATARNHQETTESNRGTICSKEENDTNTSSSRDFVERARERIVRTMKRGGGGGEDYIHSITTTDETSMEHLDHRTNDRMDSDDAIPICPVDAELHIKEEVELFDDEDEDESSRLLLERLTRPQATSSSGRHNVDQAASNMSSYDLAAASSSHDHLPPTVEMLESLPGHSSWNVTQISHDGEPGPKILKRSESLVNTNPPLRFMKSRKGTTLLVCRGYVFRSAKCTKPDKYYWRCNSSKGRKCSARCHTDDTRIVKEVGQHNHEPDLPDCDD